MGGVWLLEDRKVRSGAGAQRLGQAPTCWWKRTVSQEEDQVLKSEQAQRHANGWRHDEDAVQRRAQATSCYCRADSNGRVGRPVKCVSQARQRPGPLRALGLINCSADDLIRKLAPWVPTQNVNWRGEASRLAKRAPCWEWRELVGGLAQPRSLWGHEQVISLMGLSFLFSWKL